MSSDQGRSSSELDLKEIDAEVAKLAEEENKENRPPIFLDCHEDTMKPVNASTHERNLDLLPLRVQRPKDLPLWPYIGALAGDQKLATSWLEAMENIRVLELFQEQQKVHNEGVRIHYTAQEKRGNVMVKNKAQAVALRERQRERLRLLSRFLEEDRMLKEGPQIKRKGVELTCAPELVEQTLKEEKERMQDFEDQIKDKTEEMRASRPTLAESEAEYGDIWRTPQPAEKPIENVED